MKTYLKICSIVTILLVAGIILILCAGANDPYIPKEGIWFCEELQIQISFEPNQRSFKLVGEHKITCSWRHDKNSRYISVVCLEDKDTMYAAGDVVFSGKYVALDKQQYVLSDDTGKTYTFLRIA